MLGDDLTQSWRRIGPLKVVQVWILEDVSSMRPAVEIISEKTIDEFQSSEGHIVEVFFSSILRFLFTGYSPMFFLADYNIIVRQ